MTSDICIIFPLRDCVLHTSDVFFVNHDHWTTGRKWSFKWKFNLWTFNFWSCSTITQISSQYTTPSKNKKICVTFQVSFQFEFQVFYFSSILPYSSLWNEIKYPSSNSLVEMVLSMEKTDSGSCSSSGTTLLSGDCNVFHSFNNSKWRQFISSIYWEFVCFDISCVIFLSVQNKLLITRYSELICCTTLDTFLGQRLFCGSYYKFLVILLSVQ